jgi:SAM-dependent methyltransferase
VRSFEAVCAEAEGEPGTVLSHPSGKNNGAVPRGRPGGAPANFDRLARIYRWMEYASFGPWLARCRCAFFPELAECRRALVLGDGDGRFTARLLDRIRKIEVDAVDASAAMLRALVRRAGVNRERLRVECADARAWRPRDAAYDLVVTHFFLDCLTTEEVRALSARIRGATDAGGRWVISEFAVPPGWFGRVVARPIVAALYAAFGLMTGMRVRALPEHFAALRSCGFVLERRRVWLSGLLVSEMWRAQSAGSRPEGPTNPVVCSGA